MTMTTMATMTMAMAMTMTTMAMLMTRTCVPPRRPSHSRRKTPLRSPSPPSQFSGPPEIYIRVIYSTFSDKIFSFSPFTAFRPPLKVISVLFIQLFGDQLFFQIKY